ncbi:hypothetical protein MCAG_01794 [Micromonospora sp. ATCC 39149]|nr:hypothetical protein MCAG_01794 [Micromonospora sp. ATCC 39149]
MGPAAGGPPASPASGPGRPGRDPRLIASVDPTRPLSGTVAADPTPAPRAEPRREPPVGR